MEAPHNEEEDEGERIYEKGLLIRQNYLNWWSSTNKFYYLD